MKSTGAPNSYTGLNSSLDAAATLFPIYAEPQTRRGLTPCTTNYPIAHGLKLKPLPASARVIVDKPLPGGGTQQGGGDATDLGDGLEEEAQPEAGAAEQGAPDARGENKRPPYSVTRRATDGGGPSAVPAEKGRGEKESKDPAQGGGGGAGPPAGSGPASTDGKTLVLQPTSSTGMKRPAGAPAPTLGASERGESWYGRNTPTGQAMHAHSTQQTEDKARRFTAEPTGHHVKYRMALRIHRPRPIHGQLHSERARRPTGPRRINYVRPRGPRNSKVP